MTLEVNTQLPFSRTRQIASSFHLERSSFYASGVETITHTLPRADRVTHEVSQPKMAWKI